MKNKERYAKEIIEIACSGNSIAVTKEFGHIESCANTFCNECLFCADNCKERVREWAESEYIEKPVISKKDREFLDYLKESAKWMTRESNSGISVWMTEEPKKNKSINMWVGGIYNCLSMFNIDFPMVKLEDNKPWRIDDLKKLEVVEEYG